jgi:isocitrate dehydrogenase kinase/phosphatase
MSGDVWYNVAKNDVFPETFGPFLLSNPLVREVFMRHHADLLQADFWQAHKDRILAGHVHDVFPYERERRFVVQRAQAALAAELAAQAVALEAQATALEAQATALGSSASAP